MPDTQWSFTVERFMAVPPTAVFEAWTEGLDRWFAAPGAIRMHPVPGEPFWFEVIHEGVRHPHYGRFLALEPGRLIEQTWVTGAGGTLGAETVVRVELVGSGSGTDLRLTHSGFADGESTERHAQSWPHVLAHLEDVLTAPG